MPGRLIELRFPAAGVVRRPGFRDSYDAAAPYPTPWAINMRPEDILAGRRRGGSRPGLTAFDIDDVAENDREDDEKIMARLSSVPSGAYPVVRNESIYAIRAAGVTTINVSTGATSGLVATKGEVPGDCLLGAVYRDRIVMAGADNAIYLSRQGNPLDWDIGADIEDGGRPVVLQLAESGKIGGVCTSLVPHRDAFMLAATRNTLWVVSGDPAASGTLRNVSWDVGMVGPRAWTRVDGSVVFLANDGLWAVGANGSELQHLSDDIPGELEDVPTTTSVVLGHDPREKGVHIYLVPATGSPLHWYFDLPQKGFWPFSLPVDPVAAYRSHGSLILATSASETWEVGGDDDAGTAIESHLVLGPFRPGSAGEFGMVTSLHGVVATDSGGEVAWRLVAGETPEAACENAKAAVEAFRSGGSYSEYVASSGTWSSGRAHLSYPRVRSMWFCLWLESSDVWAYEGVTLEIARFGRWR